MQLREYCKIEKKQFHGEPKNPKQKWIKAKINSKPIPNKKKKEKRKKESNIAYPNVKKKKDKKDKKGRREKCTGASSNDLIVADFSSLCDCNSDCLSLVREWTVVYFYLCIASVFIFYLLLLLLLFFEYCRPFNCILTSYFSFYGERVRDYQTVC